MWKRMICCGLAMLVVAGAAWAQDPIEDDPGYVNLDEFTGWFDEEPSIIVNIKGALLALVAEASRYEDPDLADLLHKLRSVQVRGFDLDWASYDDVKQRTNAFAKRLEARGWDTVVRVRQRGDEHVHIHARVSEGAIAGMMVMVVSPDEDETVFLNIVGEIDPQQIGRIGRKFDIEPLDDMTVDF